MSRADFRPPILPFAATAATGGRVNGTSVLSGFREKRDAGVASTTTPYRNNRITRRAGLVTPIIIEQAVLIFREGEGIERETREEPNCIRRRGEGDEGLL